ncbi:uncharacterized protein LJ206_011215 isoform 1-T1 [Theristicus caerulescens]
MLPKSVSRVFNWSDRQCGKLCQQELRGHKLKKEKDRDGGVCERRQQEPQVQFLQQLRALSGPTAEAVGMPWGEALGGGGGKEAKKLLCGEPAHRLGRGGELSPSGPGAEKGCRPARPRRCRRDAGAGWGAGAPRVGLRAAGGESSAGRWQPPRARPPAEEQPAAVPGRWRRPGNSRGEAGRRPRAPAGRGARSWTRRGDEHGEQKRRRTFI